MRRVVLVLILLTAILGGLIAWRLHAQETALAGPAGGSGEIEGTRIDLGARLSARIEAIRVREGAPVKAGELLVQLDCAEPRAALAEAEARVAAARAQARAAEVSIEAARRTRVAARRAREAALAQARSLASQRDAGLRQAERLERLAQDVSASRLDEARTQAEGLSHQAAAAEAQAAASAQQAQAAEVNVRAAQAQAGAAESALGAAEAAAARARLMVDECRIVAPRDAWVDELPREPGELVGPGAVLARLVDLSEVHATFYLPNAELGAVRPGAAARVVADAWPDEVFEGTVETVAFEAEFTPRNIQTRTDRDRLVYPVKVAVPNPAQRLRPGMPVQVTLPGTGR